MVDAKPDVKKVRRAAEDAAREALAGTLVGAAGELGVAQAEHDRVKAGADAVEQRAAEIMAAATAEADKLRAAHTAAVEDADAAYGKAWQTARDAGWSNTQLAGMGYRRPTASRRTRRAADQAEPAAGGGTSDTATGAGDAPGTGARG